MDPEQDLKKVSNLPGHHHSSRPHMCRTTWALARFLFGFSSIRKKQREISTERKRDDSAGGVEAAVRSSWSVIASHPWKTKAAVNHLRWYQAVKR